jgi:hypothetical protein
LVANEETVLDLYHAYNVVHLFVIFFKVLLLILTPPWISLVSLLSLKCGALFSVHRLLVCLGAARTDLLLVLKVETSIFICCRWVYCPCSLSKALVNGCVVGRCIVV